MKIKLNAELKTLQGETLKEGNDNITLKSVMVGALLIPEENIAGTEKAKRYGLAVKIETSTKEVELEVEDVALIKEVIGKFYTTLIVGQCYELLK